MSIKLKTATVLLALVAAACAALPSVSALAATGGAAAPATKPAASKSRVHTTGVATWFGPGFYGKKTACGQTLTPSVIGVANRTLPCGTLIKVSYHGQALTVPVLDRGPTVASPTGTSRQGRRRRSTSATRFGSARASSGSVPNSPMLGLPAEPPPPRRSPAVRSPAEA